MGVKKVHIFCLFSLLAMTAGAIYGLEKNSFKRRTVHLSTFERPPYSSKIMIQSGLSSSLMKDLLRRSGITLKPHLSTLERTLWMARSYDKIEGYYPEYYSKERSKEFLYSRPIGRSIIGFAERVDDPVKWTKLEDLRKIGPIGVVRSSMNSPKFDEMVRSGKIRTTGAATDLDNLKGLISGSIRFAVIDKRVMDYLLSSGSALSEYADELKFNKKILINRTLHACIKKSSARSKELIHAINQGIKHINLETFEEQYLQLAKARPDLR